jgi:hypothetical protein
MGIARGHHWISQTYLARFTADGRKASMLHIVDLERQYARSNWKADVWALDALRNRLSIACPTSLLESRGKQKSRSRLACYSA